MRVRCRWVLVGRCVNVVHFVYIVFSWLYFLIISFGNWINFALSFSLLLLLLLYFCANKIHVRCFFAALAPTEKCRVVVKHYIVCWAAIERKTTHSTHKGGIWPWSWWMDFDDEARTGWVFFVGWWRGRVKREFSTPIHTLSAILVLAATQFKHFMLFVLRDKATLQMFYVLWLFYMFRDWLRNRGALLAASRSGC